MLQKCDLNQTRDSSWIVSMFQKQLDTDSGEQIPSAHYVQYWFPKKSIQVRILTAE